MTDNLPDLRDIHLPEGVSIFPPAYGWWVLLVAVIAAILLYHLIKYLRTKSKKLYALRLLSNINPNIIIPSAVEISEILRRICVYKYPEAGALYGKDWIDFLNSHSAQTITATTADLLLNAPYAPTNTNTYTKNDIDDLIIFAKGWIGENL